MADKKHTVKLIHLYCYANEELKEDEVFIKYKGRRIWPVNKKYARLKPGEKKEIGVDIPDVTEGEMLTLEVWDWDLFSANDLLGSATMKVDGPGGPYLVDMRPSSAEETARYSIQWQVPWTE
ncbi:MAG: hypothetical protein RIF33_03780 [Cyclobacteriaceae bacterium]